MSHNLDLGPQGLSAGADADFVAQLRTMAATNPQISVPGTGTIVAAGRSRVARRRSAFAGAFGVALLAGAGLSTMPHVGLVNPGVAPVAAVSHVEAITQRDLPIEPAVAVAPLDQGVELHPGTSRDYPIEGAQDGGPVTEAGPTAGGAIGLSPLATGLGIAGTASLATAAGLALRSRRLQLVTVARRNS